MNATVWIIIGLSLVLLSVIAFGGMYLNYEKTKHEKEKERIRREGAENAKRTSDAITEAEKIKSNASTGNHSSDIGTMARQLQIYADSGK